MEIEVRHVQKKRTSVEMSYINNRDKQETKRGAYLKHVMDYIALLMYQV